MNKKIKIPVLFLSFFLILMLFPQNVRAASSDTITRTVSISGGNFGGNASLTLSYDPKWLTVSSLDSYNPDLAKFACIMSSGTYDNVIVKTDGVRGFYNQLNSFGFDNIERTKVLNQDDYDSYDTSEVIMATREDAINGRNYTTFLIFVLGTSSDEHWYSNFDVGDPDDTNPHPDWKDKKNHKGFDVTANRVDAVVNDYIARKQKADSTSKVLYTGHSRGASIANILGAMHRDNSVAYTFASSNTTKNSNASSYTNVHNIVNSNDIVTNVPTSQMGGFRRFGQDIICDVSSNEEVQKRIVEYGGSYFPADISDAIGILNNIWNSGGDIGDIIGDLIDFVTNLLYQVDAIAANHYCVASLAIINPLGHELIYAESGNTLTVKCKNHPVESLSINLATRDTTYFDTVKNAEISGNIDHRDWSKLGIDYEFYYTDGNGNKLPDVPADAGSYYAVVDVLKNGTVQITLKKPFSIVKKRITSGFVTLESPFKTYTGTEITNNVRVMNDGMLLIEGKDYNLSGNKGTNKGKYTVIVSGIGNYTGTGEEDWYIFDKADFDPDKLKIIAPIAGPITYGQSLKYSTLSKGSVTYDNIEIPGEFVWEDSSVIPTVNDSGKTYYTVEFKPSGSGVSEKYSVIEREIIVTVNPRQLTDNDVIITVPDTYTGDNLIDFITVDLPGGTDLDFVKNVDYEVSCIPSPVIEPGVYKAIITFKGNYIGRVEKRFVVARDGFVPTPPSGGGSGYPSGGGSSGGSLSRPPVTTQTPVIKDNQSSQDTKEETSTETDILEMLYAHPDAGKALPLIRMYNPVSGEHIMTTDANEADTLEAKHGWKREAMTGTSSKANDSPVFRLVHPATGKHIYSMNENEVRVLTTEQGWESDGIVFFAGGSNVKMYRLYNPSLPAAIAHHYTTDEVEYNTLQSQGWTGEGVAFTLD